MTAWPEWKQVCGQEYLVVTKEIAEQLILSVLSHDADVEVCGLIYGSAVYDIRNIARDRQHYFEMDAPLLAEMYTKFGAPDAIWHSHPNAPGLPAPSSADLAGAPSGVPYLIINSRLEIGVWVFDQR